MEFHVNSEPKYDIAMENQIEPDDITESDLDTGAHVKNEPEIVCVKSEPADVWMKNEPEVVYVKSEPKTDNDCIEYETYHQEIKFVASNTDSFVVRILTFVIYLAKNFDPLKSMFFNVPQRVNLIISSLCCSLKILNTSPTGIFIFYRNF